MWQLSKNGTFTKISENINQGSIEIDPSVDNPLEGLSLNGVVRVQVRFASHADGRGFSIAKLLSEQYENKVTLVAVGKLIPDQARLAFQSGFDLIEIDDVEVLRHSEVSWRDALTNAVPEIYFQTIDEQSALRNIWSARQNQ